MSLQKGDIVHCLIESFSDKYRYCIVLEIVDKHIDVLPITTQIRPGDGCECLDCAEDCTKLRLYEDDTTKTFKKTSYIFLTKYTIGMSCCHLGNIRNHKISDNLKRKLKNFKFF